MPLWKQGQRLRDILIFTWRVALKAANGKQMGALSRVFEKCLATNLLFIRSKFKRLFDSWDLNLTRYWERRFKKS